MSQVMPASNAQATLMIIEDDVEIARLTSMYLEGEGYQVICVENGNEAIAAIKQHQPDLIILDLMLPNMHGSDICKQAREFYFGPIDSIGL